MKIEETKQLVRNFKYDCKSIISKLGYDGDSCTNVDCNNLSDDDRFLLDRLIKALDGLQNYVDEIDYTTCPIKAVGELQLHSNGRYGFGDFEYCCGTPIEYYAWDNIKERYEWRLSRIEYDDNGYYIVYDKNISLIGLKVRIR